MKLLCVLSILAVLACSDSGHFYNAGDVARAYYDRVQKGEFQSAMELWDAERASDSTKWGLAWPQALARVQREYGALESYDLYDQTDMQSGSGERILRLTYRVQYARARIPERLVVRIPTHADGSMVITGHDIMTAEANR